MLYRARPPFAAHHLSGPLGPRSVGTAPSPSLSLAPGRTSWSSSSRTTTLGHANSLLSHALAIRSLRGSPRIGSAAVAAARPDHLRPSLFVTLRARLRLFLASAGAASAAASGRASPRTGRPHSGQAPRSSGSRVLATLRATVARPRRGGCRLRRPIRWRSPAAAVCSLLDPCDRRHHRSRVRLFSEADLVGEFRVRRSGWRDPSWPSTHPRGIRESKI